MIPGAEQVVQIAVDALLDGRPVTTLTGGSLVPWTVGIDKDDGYITSAAAQFLKQTGSALPDDATFPESATHPEMVLHFSNTASATSPQARGVAGAAQFAFDVPHGRYSQLYLALTSSYGDSPLSVSFSYADTSTSALQFTLPDWGTGSALPSEPPIFFNLITGLHKWNHDNASVDTPTHTITGVKLSPDSSKELNRVQISKMGTTPYLVFWGATGVATSALNDTPSGAAGASGAGGTSGSANAGASGSSPSGAGMAGMVGSAGAAQAGLSGAGGASGNPTASDSAGSAQGAALGAATAGNGYGAAAPDSGGCAVGTRGSRRAAVPSPIWLCALCALLWLRRANSSR